MEGLLLRTVTCTQVFSNGRSWEMERLEEHSN